MTSILRPGSQQPLWRRHPAHEHKRPSHSDRRAGSGERISFRLLDPNACDVSWKVDAVSDFCLVVRDWDGNKFIGDQV